MSDPNTTTASKTGNNGKNTSGATAEAKGNVSATIQELQSKIMEAVALAQQVSRESGEDQLTGFFQQVGAQLRNKAIAVKRQPEKVKRDADRAAAR